MLDDPLRLERARELLRQSGKTPRHELEAIRYSIARAARLASTATSARTAGAAAGGPRKRAQRTA